MRFVQDQDGARVDLWTENDAEARMLSSLEPMDYSLKVQATIERSGVYGGAPIKSIQLSLRPEKIIDPDPLA